MSEGRSHVRAPLFDRLTGPVRSLDRAGLRESVRRELERLLNTRTPIPASQLTARTRTVVDYGIPDFSMFTPGNPDDRQRLADFLAGTIEAFEPRLRNVRVRVEEVQGERQLLRARLDADLRAETISEPISFPALIGLLPGTSEVYDAR
jgi:type VI secretion system lysozyme-like protein